MFRVTFFGTRGSTAISSSDTVRFGGNTTCILINAGQQTLIYDCGTGLLPLQSRFLSTEGYRQADILISHIHWDHIQGIAFFAPFFMPEFRFEIYGQMRNGLTVADQIKAMMDSPMFPIAPDAFRAQMIYHNVQTPERFRLGQVEVETLALNHPNICTGYRLWYQGYSLTLMMDYEHEADDQAAVEFARNCDLLIYDGQYTDQEYPAKKGWGHSTWQQGLSFAARAQAKRLVLSHHDPMRTDLALNRLQEAIGLIDPYAAFAYEGMVIDVDRL